MDICTMIFEVLRIPYPMVSKSPLPNLNRVLQLFLHGMRESAFDELHRTFKRDLRRSQQQMKMFGHEDKGVEPKLSLSAIRVESLQKETRNRFICEQISALPGD